MMKSVSNLLSFIRYVLIVSDLSEHLSLYINVSYRRLFPYIPINTVFGTSLRKREVHETRPRKATVKGTSFRRACRTLDTQRQGDTLFSLYLRDTGFLRGRRHNN